MFKVFDIAREALGSVAKAAAKVPVIENKYHVNARLRGGSRICSQSCSQGACYRK